MESDEDILVPRAYGSDYSEDEFSTDGSQRGSSKLRSSYEMELVYEKTKELVYEKTKDKTRGVSHGFRLFQS